MGISSSTFRSYRQDVWPARSVAMVNTKEASYSDGGKVLSVPKGFVLSAANQQEGLKDIHRSGLRAFVLVNSEGGLQKVFSGSVNENAEAEAGARIKAWIKDEQSGMTSFCKTAGSDYLTKAFCVLPHLRAQGMFSNALYLMSPGLDNVMTLQKLGMQGVSEDSGKTFHPLGCYFEDYCIVYANNADAKIVNLSVMFNAKNELAGVMRRVTTATENGDQFDFRVNSDFLLPETFAQVLGHATAIGKPTTDVDVKSMLKDLNHIKGLDKIDLIDGRIDLAENDRQDLLSRAIKTISGVYKPEQQEPEQQKEQVISWYNVPQFTSDLASAFEKGNEIEIEQAAEKLDAIYTKFVAHKEVLEFHLENQIFIATPDEALLEGPAKQNIVKLRNDFARLLVVMTQFGDSRRGEKVVDGLMYRYPSLGAIFDKVGKGLFDNPDLGTANLLNTMAGVVNSSHNVSIVAMNEVRRGNIPPLVSQAAENFLKACGFDGKGSKGQYMKPVTKLMINLAKKQLGGDSIFTKQLKKHYTIMPVTRWLHNIGVWIGKVIDKAFGWGEYAKAKGSAPASRPSVSAPMGLPNSVNVIKSKGIMNSSASVNAQVQNFVNAWIPALDQPAKKQEILVFDQAKFEELFDSVKENASHQNASHLSKQLIGAGLYHFLVGAGKNTDNRDAMVVNLVDKLQEVDHSYFQTAEEVMQTSRQRFSDLFDHRLDGVAAPDNGFAETFGNIDPMRGYNDAKVELFKIVLSHELPQLLQQDKRNLLEKLDQVYTQCVSSSGKKMPEIPAIKEFIAGTLQHVETADRGDSSYGGSDCGSERLSPVP